MAEVATIRSDSQDRGRPRWSRMRSRLVEHDSKISHATQDQDVKHLLNTHTGFHSSDNYVFGAETWPVSVSTALIAKENVCQPRKQKVKAVEKKKPRRRKGLKATFSSLEPAIIGEGGDDAELPANEVRHYPVGIRGRNDREAQNLQNVEFDAGSLVPPTVNCSTVQRRPRVRRIPTSHKIPTDNIGIDAPPAKPTDGTLSRSIHTSPSVAGGNQFIENIYTETPAPAWETNSQGWPEPSISDDLRRLEADEGKRLMAASRNGYRPGAIESPELALPRSTADVRPATLKQHSFDPNTIIDALNAPPPLVPRRRRDSESHNATGTQRAAGTLDAHPVAVSLRPRASPRESIRSLASNTSNSALSALTQPQDRSHQSSVSPHPLSRCQQDSASPQSLTVNRHHGALKVVTQGTTKPEHLAHLAPLTYIPPTISKDSKPGRNGVPMAEIAPPEPKTSVLEKPVLREKNPNRNHMISLPESARRPSVPFLAHREEAFSSLVHPAFRRSSVDSLHRSSQSPRRRCSQKSPRSSINHSKATPSIDEATYEGISDDDATLNQFLARTSHLTSQISLPSHALPLSKHTTPKWLQTAIYWFLRGRQGVTKYILLLRNGAPAGSHLSSDSIMKILTQQHMNFFKTWWIISEVLGERLVALAGSGEMYSREGSREEDDKNAELFELTDILVERFKEVVAWLSEHEMLPGNDLEERMKKNAGRLDTSLWFVDDGFTDDLGALRERLIKPWGI